MEEINIIHFRIPSKLFGTIVRNQCMYREIVRVKLEGEIVGDSIGKKE